MMGKGVPKGLHGWDLSEWIKERAATDMGWTLQEVRDHKKALRKAGIRENSDDAVLQYYANKEWYHDQVKGPRDERKGKGNKRGSGSAASCTAQANAAMREAYLQGGYGKATKGEEATRPKP